MDRFIFTPTFSILYTWVISTHGLSVLDSSDLNCTNSTRLPLSMALFSISIISRGLMTLPTFCSGAHSWTPWVRKFDYPCIWEILVIMLPYACLSEPQACQCKISQSTGIPNKCNSRLFWREITWPPTSYEAETIIKESLKTKQKAEIVSASLLSNVLILA